jgi:nitronate monooxygenase
MALPPILQGLRIPVIGAPMFIVSNPKLVIAQCTSGIVGGFPALNARPASALDEWLHEITEALAAWDRDHPERPAAPFAVNQIVHRSNDRLDHDMEVCAKWKVPIVISSLGARVELNDAVHSWGGITLHDVIDDRFARKAVEKGADGIIAVAAGAGGHAGRWSPFALMQEIRAWFDGPLILSGAMIMGNAFAAFPVMATAIGVPILIQQDGGKAAVIGAVGMLSGFCGTLMTPMAANFNIVPAALLELKSQYAVIRMQIATAIPLLIANILILYVAGFHL